MIGALHLLRRSFERVAFQHAIQRLAEYVRTSHATEKNAVGNGRFLIVLITVRAALT